MFQFWINFDFKCKSNAPHVTVHKGSSQFWPSGYWRTSFSSCEIHFI